MAEATISVASGQKKDNGWYEIKDGDGRVFATKKSEIGQAALAAIGSSAVVDYTEAVKGDFTNRYLNSVGTAVEAPASPSNGQQAAQQSSGYVKAQENPSTQRSIIASVALEHAVGTLAHTIGQDKTPKDAAERVLPLAEAYFLFLGRKANVLTEDEIPF